MEDRNYGTIRIKLDEMIEKQNISKNKLAHRAEMQRTQLNQFCKGTVTRLDTAVLARLCCALNCKIEDLLEYVPPENREVYYTVIRLCTFLLMMVISLMKSL